MPDSDRLVIRCGASTLTILPTRLLLRGPQSWAIRRAALTQVTCAQGSKEDYEVTLRLRDGRHFLLRGIAPTDLGRLATALGDIDGPPPSLISTAWDSRPLQDSRSSIREIELASALPPAEYQPDLANATEVNGGQVPTEPAPQRTQSTQTPPHSLIRPTPRPTGAPATLSGGLSSKIWLPHVTLPPTGTPTNDTAATLAPSDDAEQDVEAGAPQGATPRPPAPPPTPKKNGTAGGPSSSHPKDMPKRTFWP